MVENRGFEEIIRSGGDHRLDIIQGSFLNLYGCSPTPYEHISYSSSTASTVSFDAYNHARNIFDRVCKLDDLSDPFQNVRDRLRSYIGLDDSVDIALGPSGTDMELISLLASIEKNPVVSNILVARDEVGSGIEFAASGRHSSSTTPSGKSATKGDYIAGFEKHDIELESVSVRHSNGSIVPVDDVLKDVVSKIESATARGRRVLLHLVYRTKTGIISPCFYSIKKLMQKYSENLDVVVDACQYRMSNESLRLLLAANCMVIITGSKFYAGAPFSSALLVPESVRDRFVTNNSSIPKGIEDYFSRSELPIRWAIFNSLPSERNNVGLLLRWETALYEMTRFSAVHKERFQASVQIFHEVLDQIISSYDCFSLVREDKGVSLVTEQDSIFNQTIQTFVLEDGKKELNDAKIIYQALYQDLSPILDNPIAKTICHIGQPVKVKKNADGNWSAALRVSLNANYFAQQSGKILDKQRIVLQSELGAIFSKMKLILDNYDSVKEFVSERGTF